MESLLSLWRRHWDHEPAPNPSQEWNFRAADECLLPSWEGSGGWVGSWKASFRLRACIGTMNRDEAAAGALASWTAAVLCRFCACGPDLKAPEDRRTPKPGGTAAGSWKV